MRPFLLGAWVAWGLQYSLVLRVTSQTLFVSANFEYQEMSIRECRQLMKDKKFRASLIDVEFLEGDRVKVSQMVKQDIEVSCNLCNHPLSDVKPDSNNTSCQSCGVLIRSLMSVN